MSERRIRYVVVGFDHDDREEAEIQQFRPGCRRPRATAGVDALGKGWSWDVVVTSTGAVEIGVEELRAANALDLDARRQPLAEPLQEREARTTADRSTLTAI